TSGFALASLPGPGHEKLSARPAGAAKVSPRLKPFPAIESDVVCGDAPSSSLPWSPPLAVNGNIGPTSGLASAGLDFGVVSGAGSATGATALGITRRSSRST